MRWIIFGLMVIITPIAFGGDLTPARLYLQRASSRHAVSVRKPWNVRSSAIYWACFGAAVNVIGTLSAPPAQPDFTIQAAALASTALLFAGLGAGIAKLRNWVTGVGAISSGYIDSASQGP